MKAFLSRSPVKGPAMGCRCKTSDCKEAASRGALHTHEEAFCVWASAEVESISYYFIIIIISFLGKRRGTEGEGILLRSPDFPVV